MPCVQEPVETHAKLVTMMIKTKSLVFLFLSLLLCSYSLGYQVLVRVDSEDPKGTRTEIESCKRRCETEKRGERAVQPCQQRCEEEAIKKREQEQEKGEEERHHYPGRQTKDPERQYQECSESCQRQSPRQQPQCLSRCRQQYEDQKRRQEEGRRGYPRIEEEQSENPYYFPARRLQSRYESEHGSFKVVERFNRRSRLLRGIENYRIAFFEANPNAFFLPHHCDAEGVGVVLRGKGTITLVMRDNKETYNVERGDVLRLKSGATVYGANRDDKEQLRVAILAQPVNTPGIFKEYFSAGGQNPESFFKVFSDDILESSFDTSRDQIDKLFRQQKQGAIVKASKEQIEALSRHASSTKQRGRESSRLFNLLQQKPVDSNRYGRFFEARPEEYDQLKDVNVFVGLVEIKQGAVLVPHYNSRSTVIGVVEQGKGRIEMACPHVGSQEQQGSQGRWRPEGQEGEQEEQSEGRVHFEKVSSELSTGDVYIIPAGHPHAVIASQNENFRALSFGINGWNNQKNFLAGQDNILNQVEREAKELSFNVPSEQVDQILGKQQESHFVPARGQRREEDMGRPLASILELTNYF